MANYFDLARMQMPANKEILDRVGQMRARRQQPNQGDPMDPRAAQVRALMKQGLSYEEAMRKVAASG